MGAKDWNLREKAFNFPYSFATFGKFLQKWGRAAAPLGSNNPAACWFLFDSIFNILRLLGTKPKKVWSYPRPHPHSLGFIGDETPKNPEIKVTPVPEITPIFFRGFSGIYPQKNPKFNLSPTPKNPQFFSYLGPIPAPNPENRGGDGENRGLGPRFTTLVNIAFM